MSQAAIHEITVEIGRTPITLRTQEPAFLSVLEQRYAGFMQHAGAPRFALDIDIRPDDDPITELEELEVSFEAGRWRLRRGDFAAHWDPQQRRGTVKQGLNPYAIDSVLRIVHSLILAQEGGFLLHGASAIRNGRAFLFSGVSGAGKTTISSLIPPDATLLTDEISYIRREGDSYMACGTPFAGELARYGENATAPITQLFFLAKGPENRIEPISPADALRMLLRNILFFAHDAQLVEMVFRSACEFLGQVPAARLTFYPDARVWDLVR